MGDLKIQFITDEQGQKIGVVLSIDQYNQLLEQLEELEDIRDYNQHKADDEPTIPFSQATEEIEKQRDDL